MMNARYLAVKILLSLDKSLYIQSALDMHLNKYHLIEKDKGLCTELAYGYLRNEIRINFILKHFLKNINNIPEEMLISLGISIYSILFLTKTPDYASVNWAVEHIKQRFNLKLSKVANAVLRNVVRQSLELDSIKFYSNKNNSDLEAYSLFYSMPLWISKLWKEHYGVDTAILLMKKFSQKPNVGLRLNCKHKDYELVKNTLIDLGGTLIGEHGIVFDSGRVPKMINGESIKNIIISGICTYQSHGSISLIDTLSIPDTLKNIVTFNCVRLNSKSSILGEITENNKSEVLLYSTDNHKGRVDIRVKGEFIPSESTEANGKCHSFNLAEPIWDMCAGQGGKTCGLIERGYKVELATDVNLSRLGLLSANIRRLSLKSPLITMVDKQHSCINAWKGTILIDAPCSGLGILNRRPDIKRIKTFDDMKRYVFVQKELLNCAWSKLLVGGTILYVTCTINPLENSLQIKAFLEENANASLEGEWQTDFNDFSCEGMYCASICKK